MSPIAAVISRRLALSGRRLSASSLFSRNFCLSSSQSPTTPKLSSSPSRLQIPLIRFFCSSSSAKPTNVTAKINTKVNFSLPSDSEDEEETTGPAAAAQQQPDKSKLPPPYNPFEKKPVIEEPDDPEDLQQVFHKMRTEGLTNNAVKMFDGLSKDGLTHEALELFSQIKDKGHMPDVVAHTAVIEAYATAGKAKESVKVFLRMLASGVAPNAYTYAVLIKGLARDGTMFGDAKKYMMEMMEKGMKPNVGTYTAVFAAFAQEGKVEEGKEFVRKMKERGFAPEEKAVRETLAGKRGQAYRGVIDILFGQQRGIA